MGRVPSHHRRNRRFCPPPHQIELGAKNFAFAEGAGEKLAFFHLENEVYLAKIAFASEYLEKFSTPAGYFFVQHLWFCTTTVGKYR